MSDEEYKPERDKNGYFKKGVSGNPKGRPSGRNKTTEAIYNMMEGEADKLSRKAIDMALRGDITALKLCLDKLLPRRRGSPVRFNLPKVTKPSDMPMAIGAVSEAMAAGELSPEEATSITVVLEAQRRSFELADHEERLKKLEELTNGG